MSFELDSLRESLTVAINMARGLMSLNTDVAVKKEATGLYDSLLSSEKRLMDSYSAYTKLLDEKRSIEKELEELKSWKHTESQYEHFYPSPRVPVVVAKVGNQPQDKAQWYCAHCFENKKKRILNPEYLDEYNATYKCPECKTEFKFHFKDKPPDANKISHWSDGLGF